MENRTLRVVVPANVAAAILEVAKIRGTSVSDWLAHTAADSMTVDELRLYRRAWAEAALASYEDEFGVIPAEDVDAMRRNWLTDARSSGSA